VYAIADEDLERETAEKTASVHFLRFELTPAMVSALKAGAAVTMGIDHPAYSASVKVTQAVRDSLVGDLKG
jgi:ABC-type sugar transport system substrate-binding protein